MNTAYQIALTAAGFAALGVIAMAVMTIFADEFDIPNDAVGAALLIIIIGAIVAVVSSMIGVWI